ncbi:MAG: PIG-L deacetylase family protein [Syntrophorhabdales bacterium]|jgi:LmbE family N-acetylglucosaminyl deacetylase
MLTFGLKRTDSSHLRILCLGAHSDDIEIGCGGTIIRLLEEDHSAEIHWVVFSAIGERASEAEGSADLFLSRVGKKTIRLESFKDGFFPYMGAEIKEYFEQLKGEFVPDMIFTHFRNDLHQDHRLICELTWNTFRNHLILEYEIPKYDGDLGSPNLFVHLTDEMSTKKIDHIRKHFKTQSSRQWFTDDMFLSLMRLRGMESNAPERYAEAFYCRKMVV